MLCYSRALLAPHTPQRHNMADSRTDPGILLKVINVLALLSFLGSSAHMALGRQTSTTTTIMRALHFRRGRLASGPSSTPMAALCHQLGLASRRVIVGGGCSPLPRCSRLCQRQRQRQRLSSPTPHRCFCLYSCSTTASHTTSPSASRIIHGEAYALAPLCFYICTCARDSLSPGPLPFSLHHDHPRRHHLWGPLVSTLSSLRYSNPPCVRLFAPTNHQGVHSASYSNWGFTTLLPSASR
ncbi:hypothetical protein BOTBODRAFT_250092 [Botryobasidium botryosum FD-172 SS1]|uniref:Uncharacterized protein n=1 Tax=Botryobasidium botryosum (strain FD-172 SS1) TaxID=930990 RepID=A0A067MP34_BOTB1|nr:hypothetical protein BOTBODRAFT_250092 [Botryobasidium botryosum FD-172 SS1]